MLSKPPTPQQHSHCDTVVAQLSAKVAAIGQCLQMEKGRQTGIYKNLQLHPWATEQESYHVNILVQLNEVLTEFQVMLQQVRDRKTVLSKGFLRTPRMTLKKQRKNVRKSLCRKTKREQVSSENLLCKLVGVNACQQILPDGMNGDVTGVVTADDLLQDYLAPDSMSERQLQMLNILVEKSVFSIEVLTIFGLYP
jgi:hypothetical protein